MDEVDTATLEAHERAGMRLATLLVEADECPLKDSCHASCGDETTEDCAWRVWTDIYAEEESR